MTNVWLRAASSQKSPTFGLFHLMIGFGDVERTNESVSLIYIGSVLPDAAEFHTRAFSRAGSMFQENLLTGLREAGIETARVVSVRQIEAYPRSSRLWVRGESARLANGCDITLLSFLNISPIKQIQIGLSSLVHIVLWGWQSRRSKHRVVYTYNLSVPPGLFTLLGARLICAKAVVSLNDINVPGQTVPSSLYQRLDFFLQRKLIPRFDGHVVVADTIMKDFAPGRAYVRVEGGVTEQMIEKFSSTGRRSLHAETFNIVSVGSLKEANGFRVLIEAFSLIADSRFRLILAGAGPLEDEIRNAAALDPRIEFCGLLGFEEVLELYKRADVLVNMRLTRLLDTRYFFPSKIMEYLVTGVPVISTGTGHVEGDFSEFVFLLREETAEALASLIQRVALLDRNTRESNGNKARHFMKNHKTWTAQGSKVAQYVREVVGDSRDEH